jgi:hypothetical protein
MAWIRVETKLPRDPKIAGLSTHEAKWTYIVLLCAASEQGGKFESAKHLEACMPYDLHRYLPELEGVGLLIRDGESFSVANWDTYQRPYDPRAATRQAAYRSRKAHEDEDHNGDHNAPVTNHALRYDTIRHDTSPTGKPPKAPTERQQLLGWFKDRKLSSPTGYVLTDAVDMLKGYGLQATLSAFTAAAAEGAKTSKAIVSTAERNLRIKPRALPKQNGFVPADTSIYDKEA